MHTTQKPLLQTLLPRRHPLSQGSALVAYIAVLDSDRLARTVELDGLLYPRHARTQV